MYRILLSSLIVILGAALGIGGVWLVALGGSAAYLLIGLGLLWAGGLTLARRISGLTVYALVLVGTLGWALWEVGFDWWALAARGAVLAVLGILLLPVGFGLRRTNVAGSGPSYGNARSSGAPVATLGAALALTIIAAGIAMVSTPHDLAGSFDATRMKRAAAPAPDGVAPGDWPAYGRTASGQRYSPLDQITPSNVKDLKVAWTYKTGQIRGAKDPVETTYEVTPLVVNGTMYICTPFSMVIALDPVTGVEKWRFDPELKQPPVQTTQHMTCRGVSYFDGTGLAPQPAASVTPAPAPITAPATDAAPAAAPAPDTRGHAGPGRDRRTDAPQSPPRMRRCSSPTAPGM